ncbi:MAG: endo-1,4-beta-xylanase, partial [Cyclobacteriaceae bacterium]|nr:endo-1,4-beta-xylanase [Cyclobacteriaceae bacterium SS2]
NWTALDEAYNYAKDNDIIFKLHVLFWGNQQPAWIESLGQDEQLEEIIEWLDTLASRYPDMEYIEVVNEPIHDPPHGAGNGNYRNALGGQGTTGYDWIIKAFQLAKVRFPGAKLMINEYNIVNNPQKAAQYKSIVELLQAENLIDAIGVQAHAFSLTGSEEVFKSSLNILAETGLPIMVTELDIDGPTDQTQLEEYQRIFPVFWNHPAVEGITLWGFRPGLWRDEQKAYIINANNEPRPAMTWLREYVESGRDVYEILGLLPESSFMNIYPNPTLDRRFTINTEKTIVSVTVSDMNGKAILKLDDIHQNRVELNLPSGQNIYVVSVRMINGNVYSEKIIISE